MKFLDNLCSEDDEIVDKVMYKEYWYFPRISCFYPKLDTSKCRILSLFQFVLYVSCLLYNITLLTITAIKLKDDTMQMFQALNYLLVLFMTNYVLILFNKNRKHLAEVHRGIGIGLSNYDEETEIFRKPLVSEIEKKKKILYQLLLSYFSITALIMLLLLKYLNAYSGDNMKIELSPNLPLNVWIPYDTDNLIGWSATIFLIATVCIIAILICSTFDFIFFLICHYLAMELRLLIHSLNRLSERTLHLYRLRHEDENISIETMKNNRNLSNCYRDCLKQNIIHHQNIIKKFYVCKEQLGLVTWLTFAICAVVIAMSAVTLVKDEGKIGSRILSGLFGFAASIICFFFSYCCEQISSASEDLILTLYSTKWMSMNKNESLMIQIMMLRSQLPLLMNFMRITNFDYNTFSAMMNTAYSYFNLLLAFS